MSNNTNTTFGEIDYSTDIYGGNNKKQENKDLFLRLSDGSNEIRLITAPHQYIVHKYKKDPSNPKDFGQKVSCSMVHGSCQLCAAGDNPKPRWFYGVIDRKTGTYKILDISSAVFYKIRDLARNTARWGDPTKYDIDIVVNKNGGATNYYNVQPIPKEPLSATDQKIKDEADLEDLKRRCQPFTPEQVQKRLDRINGVETASDKTAAKSAPKATAKVAVNMNDDEELSEEFPAYNS